MKFLEFRIKNFKGIQLARVDLRSKSDARIHTLVGLNESGKTTVLEAIDLFGAGDEESDLRDLSGRVKQDENDLVPVGKRINFNGDVTITAVIEVEEADKRAVAMELRRRSYVLKSFPTEIEVHKRLTYANSAYVKTSGIWSAELGIVRKKSAKRDRPLTLSYDQEAWRAVVGVLRAQMPPIWYFPDFLFDFPEQIFLQPVSGEGQEQSFYRGLLQDVLHTIEPTLMLDKHILERVGSADEAQRRALDQVLLQMGRAIGTQVFDAWGRILGKSIEKRISVRVGPDPQTGVPVLSLRIEDQDGFFAVKERSLGFRWFFVFLMLTHFRSQRNETREMLFLFDEPASNLHSTAQQQLLASFEQVAQNGSRIIYTTHSHHLIDPKRLEQVFVVRNRLTEGRDEILEVTANNTDVVLEKYRSFVASRPDQTRYFQPILDVLEFRPSNFELVDDLVILEGKNDYYTLRLAGSLTGGPGLSLYPGGGAGSLDNVIALYLAWSRNFIVLLDSDAEGSGQRSRYLEKFGPILEGKIFLLEDLESRFAGIAMSDVFSPGDREAMAALAGVSPTKLTKAAMHRVIQEVLAAGSGLPLELATEAALIQLYEGLQKRLQAQSPV